MGPNRRLGSVQLTFVTWRGPPCTRMPRAQGSASVVECYDPRRVSGSVQGIQGGRCALEATRFGWRVRRIAGGRSGTSPTRLFGSSAVPSAEAPAIFVRVWLAWRRASPRLRFQFRLRLEVPRARSGLYYPAVGSPSALSRHPPPLPRRSSQHRRSCPR